MFDHPNKNDWQIHALVKKMPSDSLAVYMCSQDAMVCMWGRKNNIMQQLNNCPTILMKTFRTKTFWKRAWTQPILDNFSNVKVFGNWPRGSDPLRKNSNVWNMTFFKTRSKSKNGWKNFQSWEKVLHARRTLKFWHFQKFWKKFFRVAFFSQNVFEI
jgi:hypothetical protein